MDVCICISMHVYGYMYTFKYIEYVAVCCSVLQCVAVCCSVLQYMYMYHLSTYICIHLSISSVLQCVAVCCTVLQFTIMISVPPRRTSVNQSLIDTFFEGCIFPIHIHLFISRYRYIYIYIHIYIYTYILGICRALVLPKNSHVLRMGQRTRTATHSTAPQRTAIYTPQHPVMYKL